MKPCPNCNQPVAPGVNLCPNCGEDTRVLWAERKFGELLEVDSRELDYRRRHKGVTLGGFVMGLLMGGAVPILGVLIALTFYICFRKSSPQFARGVLFGSLAGQLGALIICFGMIPHIIPHYLP